MADSENIIELAKEKAEDFFSNTDPSHDYWHTYRVATWAIKIAEEEKADLFICELAAWLHDIVDTKLNDSKEEAVNQIREWLQKHVSNEEHVHHIMEIICTMSYRNGEQAEMTTLEGKVVQDADRLDAIGAIGIARAFAFAGVIGESLHKPASPEKEKRSTAIEHFYDKLLRLKSLMNTDTAIRVANKRQKFMISYLEQFYSEWEGKF
ncbi:HD domain-containing protein [Salibacterium salarium]|uniref:HD domain-containing protein n=1 Tax=Salibacterium salarium TaxID=284579 RepID=A0A428MUL6_9BACI|nr:HD domain-containing protein [Salibacterium salarium]RSL29843.1 HD domain-containing protein [Salibacterium salarium]